MEKSPQLLVYKASAGSGKTFTLAVQYILQLIEDPLAYRRILAVTFTNKATTEMKSEKQPEKQIQKSDKLPDRH